MSRTVGSRALTVLLGVLLAAGIAVAMPAVAQADKSDCPSGRICLWYDQNYSWVFVHAGASVPHLGTSSDQAHSVYNRTGVAWVLYDDNNYDTTDRYFCIRAGVSHPDIGAGPYRFGDKITSIQRLGSNNCGNRPQITQG